MASLSHDVDLSKAMVTDPVAASDWLVIAPIIITIIGGALCLMLRKNVRLQPLIGLAFLVLLTASNLALLIRVAMDGTITMTMGRWLPPFGISFTVDLVGALLAFVSSVVAVAVGVYAIDDIDNTGRRYGFYPFLLLLMTGVCGSFLTGDIFNLYVWFEVMVIASFGLIVLGSSRLQLDGAIKYTILNFLATTLFLVATGYLYGLLGTLNMADISLKIDQLQPEAPIGTVVMLYLFAFAMKAAAFPLNFWLPASYHAPRIVVSAVFAGLLTKVGVYALLRVMITVLPGYGAALSEVLIWLAVATMLTGALGALAQSDVRRILGYLVIAGIGSILAGIAIGTVPAIAGAVFYAVHSILVMTGLYLVIGIAGRKCGSYELNDLGGLYGAQPLLAAIFLVLALAVAGLPPFSGFWPKVILVDASLRVGWTGLAAVILITGFLATIAVGRIWIMAFWRGGPVGTPDGSQAAPGLLLPSSERRTALYGPVLVLVVLVIAIGVMPEPMFRLTGMGSSAMLDPTQYIQSVFGAGQ